MSGKTQDGSVGGGVRRKSPVVLKGVDTEAKLVYALRLFRKNPSRRVVRAALALSEQTNEWAGVSLAGKYLKLYEIKYSTKWGGSLAALDGLIGDMSSLYSRYGSEASVALDAAFSPAMSWAGNLIGVLMSRDAYTRHIVPAIAALKKARRAPGEQSEWSGSRTDDSTFEEVKL